jgi:signal-transduction protein with cAMP-binding, CBS, and nucleotidyltransferase domain
MTLNADIGCCTVAEVMGTELFTLTPETTVASARRLVDVSGNDHLIVIQDGTLAGIVCDDDLRAADRDARVADCMTSPVLCISAETTLQEAVDIMGANDVDCLPVVTGAFLVGMVTRAALALAEHAATGEPCDVCDLDSGASSTFAPVAEALRLCDRCRKLVEANGHC